MKAEASGALPPAGKGRIALERTDSAARAERMKNWLLIAVTAAFLITLAPMLLIAKYNVPYGDDVLFGAPAEKAYAETGSALAAAGAAAGVVADYYGNWQGTYAAIFLMALEPGVFGEGYYALTPFLMIGALALSSLLFARTVSSRLLGADRRTAAIVALLILLYSVQFAPSAREAFYWYNGAVYYAFFHCLFLCLLSLLILINKAKRAGSAILCGVLGVLLSAVIAGGNYATALPCGAFLALNLVCYLVPAFCGGLDKPRRAAGAAFAAIMLVVFCAGMLVSVTAPGNAVRQAAVDGLYEGLPAPAAIAVSFPLALIAILNRFDIGAVLLIALLLLFMPPYLRASRFSFRRPALAALLAFSIYACQFTPTLYAAGSPGPYRLRNVEFFNFYWLLCFVTCYVCGAAIRRREADAAPDAFESCRLRTLAYFARRPLFAVLIAACLVGGMFLQRDLTKTPVYDAVTELYSGVAEAHAKRRGALLLPADEAAGLPATTEYLPESELLS